MLGKWKVEGKESEKNDRYPAGKVEMTWWIRGSVMEVQVEVHMSLHSFSSVQSACIVRDVDAVKARLGPSSLVKMWASMMACGTVVIGVAPP